MKQIRKGCNDFKMSTLGVAFCALMLATTENAVAISFSGAVVSGCALNVENTYVCEDSVPTSAAIVSVAAGYVVIMLGSGVMKGGTITLHAGSAVQGDLEALTTVTMTGAQVTGNVTALTTFTMTDSQVDRNVWAGTTATLTNSHVGGNLSVGTTSWLGPGSYVCQNLEGRLASTTTTLLGNAAGDGAYIHGDAIAGTTFIASLGSAVNGNVTAGTTVTLATGGYINGNVTAGTTVTFSTGCIGGTVVGTRTPAKPVETDSHTICPAQELRTRCSAIIYERETY
jgi:cytoskeletal protein CcmA (bactofilin family)